MRWITRLMPLPRGIERQPCRVRGLPVERLEPPRPRAGSEILFLHGGGYCLGSIDTHRALAARIARASRSAVVLPDYPLAPENPFPAALEAAQAVYHWIEQREEAPKRLFVAGDSAGGGLALALVQRLLREGIRPVGGVCLSPWTDLTLSGVPDDPSGVGDPMITPDDALRLARYYVGDHDPRDPLVSPLFADLEGFPPLLVQVGTREILRADSERLVERALAAGVDVTFELHPGLMHVWQVFAPYVPEANRAIASIGSWIEGRAVGGRTKGGRSADATPGTSP